MIQFETSPQLLNLPYGTHGFFKRTGGESSGELTSLNCSFKVNDDVEKVIENRRRCMVSLGLYNAKLLVPNIIHGDRCLAVNEYSDIEATAHQEADALITTSYDVALGVTYADCLPVLLASIDGEVIAAIHAGWRGIRNEVIKKTVATMKGSYKVGECIAAIGPHISPEAFIVTDEALDFFMTAWPQFVVRKGLSGKVDLRGIAVHQLKDCGIIHTDCVGTFTDLDQSSYFSHRRDGGKTGRHIAIIAKTR
jgi:polyphenol oxidase